jgi:hypothetical protein
VVVGAGAEVVRVVVEAWEVVAVVLVIVAVVAGLVALPV